MSQDNAKTKQDALSADKLGSEKTSADKLKQTSKEAKGEVLTPEAKQKLISDAKAEEGRKWKQVELERDQLKDEVWTLTSRLDDIENRQTARAYEEAKTDPSGNTLKAIQADAAVRDREKKVQARENEATRSEAQLKSDKALFATESGETMVSVVAAKHGVDAERLAKLGITSKEALEAVAADMKANAPEAKTELTDEQKAAKAEAEEKGEVYTPTDETPSGAKPVELTTEGVESASMESLEQVIAPPIK